MLKMCHAVVDQIKCNTQIPQIRPPNRMETKEMGISAQIPCFIETAALEESNGLPPGVLEAEAAAELAVAEEDADSVALCGGDRTDEAVPPFVALDDPAAVGRSRVLEDSVVGETVPVTGDVALLAGTEATGVLAEGVTALLTPRPVLALALVWEYVHRDLPILLLAKSKTEYTFFKKTSPKIHSLGPKAC